MIFIFLVFIELKHQTSKKKNFLFSFLTRYKACNPKKPVGQSEIKLRCCCWLNLRIYSHSIENEQEVKTFNNDFFVISFLQKFYKDLSRKQRYEIKSAIPSVILW